MQLKKLRDEGVVHFLCEKMRVSLPKKRFFFKRCAGKVDWVFIAQQEGE